MLFLYYYNFACHQCHEENERGGREDKRVISERPVYLKMQQALHHPCAAAGYAAYIE